MTREEKDLLFVVQKYGEIYTRNTLYFEDTIEILVYKYEHNYCVVGIMNGESTFIHKV